MTANEPRARWYGWQTLTTDGASLAIAVGALYGQNATAGWFAGSGYALGGPIVHWAHGNVGKGFASLGIRAAAPFLIGFAGAGAFASGGVNGVLEGFMVGLAVGTGGAVAIDAAGLARDEVDVPREPKSAHLVPSVAPVRGGAVAGLNGAF